MKYYLVLIAVLGLYNVSYGQTNTFPTSGNVGIGIVNPTEALEVRGNIKLTTSDSNYLQLGGGTPGLGGYFQGSKEAGINAGYGSWVNHNAYWNGTNWIQPRGTLSSSLYSSNYHLGFIWEHAKAGGVNEGIIIPEEFMRLNSSGRLGIGTGSTIVAKLHVIAATEQLRLGYDASNYSTFITGAKGNMTIAAHGTNPNITLTPEGTGNVLFNGNVGIGTTVPKAKLDITGGVMIQSLLNNNSIRPLVSSNKIPGEIRGYSVVNEASDDGFLRLSTGAGKTSGVLSYIDISSYSNIPDMNMNIVFGTHGTERMRINSLGDVGIGTANPAEKLSVNGKIRAQEIKVEATNWPDYVFAKNYQLPTLGETEQHIKENGHLPGIPSAEDVKANGVNLGEMNAKLLQKIEELTLYLIEKDKQVNELENKVSKEQSTNQTQQEQINELKQQLNAIVKTSK